MDLIAVLELVLMADLPAEESDVLGIARKIETDRLTDLVHVGRVEGRVEHDGCADITLVAADEKKHGGAEGRGGLEKRLYHSLFCFNSVLTPNSMLGMGKRM